MAKTIMVVDDEVDIRNTIKTILEKNKYTVVTAVDGNDCLTKLKKQKVDLILLDVMMPGIPTREIIKKIKGVKIIIITAVRISEADREEILTDKNVVDFIQKPFDITDLLKRVKKIVG